MRLTDVDTWHGMLAKSGAARTEDVDDAVVRLSVVDEVFPAVQPTAPSDE